MLFTVTKCYFVDMLLCRQTITEKILLFSTKTEEVEEM